MKRIAVYAGSFDPITFGHLDVAKRGARLFDRVILAVGENPNKQYLLPYEQRMHIVEEATSQVGNIEVQKFSGLLVDYCRSIGACAILRGLRAVTDFEFEFQIGLANMDMAPDIETVFLLTEPSNIFISSSLVKEIASNGGNVQRYIPTPALQALNEAFSGNSDM